MSDHAQNVHVLFAEWRAGRSNASAGTPSDTRASTPSAPSNAIEGVDVPPARHEEARLRAITAADVDGDFGRQFAPGGERLREKEANRAARPGCEK